jgi:hypothetical protein
MSEFVEECRREWRRLRVPDPIANEMAADLEADLAEAAAEGASAEQVLGSGAFDPRAFAASWATERGIVAPDPPLPSATAAVRSLPVRRLRPSAAIAAIGAVAVLATLAVAVSLISFRSGSRSVAFASPAARILPGPAAGVGPGPFGRLVFPQGGDLRSAAIPIIGLLMLVVGLGGLVLWMLYWSPRAGPGRAWRRGSSWHDGIGGPG